jgi:hypothetical protein
MKGNDIQVSPTSTDATRFSYSLVKEGLSCRVDGAIPPQRKRVHSLQVTSPINRVADAVGLPRRHLQNLRVKTVSLSGIERTVIPPLCSLIICFDKLNPIPEPSLRVVKKGTKILSYSSSGMPGPLSMT